MKKIELPKLNYQFNALEPYISQKTLEFHYFKHHQTYVDKLNSLIENTEFEAKSLEQIIKNSKGAIFNNAAQVWNHTFYWNSFSMRRNTKPTQPLEKLINQEFGGLENLKKEFTNQALNLFGSGWVWLVQNEEERLEILSLPNAENPITQNKKPLLVCDVWEHAYYLDKQNRRADYVKDFWQIVDWQKISERLHISFFYF
ncbi:MAG: superoxide dismutase [Bacteroidales bacterium]|nr:superoxide dismutase [Bacteroidales bacterium]